MYKMRKKSLRLFCSLLMVIMLIPVKAAAAGPIDTTKETTLTVSFTPDGKVGTEATFRLYKVAEVTRHGEYVATGRFVEYPVSYGADSAEAWRKLATTLKGYVAADAQAAPIAIGRISQSGKAFFSTLSTGLYLVIGDKYNAFGKDYEPEPFLVSLPSLHVSDCWDYEVECEVKYTGKVDSVPVDMEVLKVWNDNENPNRPDQIEVTLYAGNIASETVTLNKENNWSYRWYGLYGKTTWSVVETKVPEGYSATVEKQGNRFVITNTKEGVVPAAGDRLPQTGVVWWPVLVLLLVGLGLFLFGVRRFHTALRREV